MGAFFCGLSLTNQQTIIFYVLPLILYICYIMYCDKLWSKSIFINHFRYVF